MNNKKYILKPGKHQFAPGSAAVHHNDTLTDREAEWYIERYPHIRSLFAPLAMPDLQTGPEEGEKEPIKQPAKSSKNQRDLKHENLFTTN